MQTLGQLIKEYRKAKGLTQGELAKELATTEQTISKYEKEIVTNVPLEKLIKIKETLKIPYDKFPDEYKSLLSIIAYGIEIPKDEDLNRIADSIKSNYGEAIEYLISTDYSPQCWQMIKSYAKGVQETYEYLKKDEAKGKAI